MEDIKCFSNASLLQLLSILTQYLFIHYNNVIYYNFNNFTLSIDPLILDGFSTELHHFNMIIVLKGVDTFNIA